MLLENILSILVGIVLIDFVRRFVIRLNIPISIIIFSISVGGILIIGGILGFINNEGPFQLFIDSFTTEPLEPIDYYWR
mgnify:CR=1 FL=1